MACICRYFEDLDDLLLQDPGLSQSVSIVGRVALRMIAHDDSPSGIGIRRVSLVWDAIGWHCLTAVVSSQSGNARQRLAREIVSDGEAREQQQEEDGEKVDHGTGLPAAAFGAFRRACASVCLGARTAQHTSVSLHHNSSVKTDPPTEGRTLSH